MWTPRPGPELISHDRLAALLAAQRRLAEHEVEVSAVDADPMMLLIDRDLATGEVRDLVRALRGLEIRWQVVLLLLDVKRLPLATVAEVLRISPNAVSALACRARAGLRKALARREPPGLPRWRAERRWPVVHPP